MSLRGTSLARHMVRHRDDGKRHGWAGAKKSFSYLSIGGFISGLSNRDKTAISVGNKHGPRPAEASGMNASKFFGPRLEFLGHRTMGPRCPNAIQCPVSSVPSFGPRGSFWEGSGLRRRKEKGKKNKERKKGKRRNEGGH